MQIYKSSISWQPHCRTCRKHLCHPNLHPRLSTIHRHILVHTIIHPTYATFTYERLTVRTRLAEPKRVGGAAVPAAYADDVHLALAQVARRLPAQLHDRRDLGVYRPCMPVVVHRVLIEAGRHHLVVLDDHSAELVLQGRLLGLDDGALAEGGVGGGLHCGC